MNYVKTILLNAFIFFTIVSCTSQQKEAPTEPVLKRLSVTEFNDMLANTDNVFVLDVRTADEFNKGHIDNAVNIDFYGSDFKDQISKLKKNQPTFLYCQGGGRSGSTLKIMEEMGFVQVYELKEGYSKWKK